MRFHPFQLLLLVTVLCLVLPVCAAAPRTPSQCALTADVDTVTGSGLIVAIAKQVCSILEAPLQSTTPKLENIAVPPSPPPVLVRSILDASKNSIGRFLLPPLPADATLETTRKRKCLVVDLDETLVHSSLEPIPDYDFLFPIYVNGGTHMVYVRKRPGAEYFLRYVAARFEVVVFTAGMDIYANPLLDILDPGRLISARLFRDSCVPYQGAHGRGHVKDLLHLGRPLQHTLIVDNSPISYLFQPNSAVPCISWFSDRNDTELYEILPFLDLIAESDNVIDTIHHGRKSQKYSFFGAVSPNGDKVDAGVGGNKLFDSSLSSVLNWKQHQQLHHKQEAQQKRRKEKQERQKLQKKLKQQAKLKEEAAAVFR